MERRNGRSGEPLYVICRTGSRAKQACEKFRRCGYDNVVAIEGGTLAWEQAGLPVSRGRKAIALDARCGSPPGCWCFSARRWGPSCIPRSSGWPPSSAQG